MPGAGNRTPPGAYGDRPRRRRVRRRETNPIFRGGSSIRAIEGSEGQRQIERTVRRHPEDFQIDKLAPSYNKRKLRRRARANRQIERVLADLERLERGDLTRSAERHAERAKRIEARRDAREIDRRVDEVLAETGDESHPTIDDVVTAASLVPGVGVGLRGVTTAGKAAVKAVTREAAEQGTKRVARGVVRRGPRKTIRRGAQNARKPQKGRAIRRPKGTERVANRAAKRQKRKARIQHAAMNPAVLKASVGGGGAGTAIAGAAATGIAEGTAEDPVKVAKTTARAVPGLVTGAVGALGHVGLTGYRAAQTAIPGGKRYSGEEILDPVEQEFEIQKKGLKDFADVYTSGDIDRIAKATQEDYGLIPLTMAIPGVGRAIRPVTRSGKTRVRRRAEARREAKGTQRRPTTAEPQALTRKGERRQMRKQEAQRSARARTHTEIETNQRGRDVVKFARRAKGPTKKLRETQTADGKKLTVTVRPGDAVGFLARQGISRDPQTGIPQIRRIAERLDDQKATDLPAHKLNTVDLVGYLLENPKVLGDKNLWKAVDAYKSQAASLNTSDVARVQPIAQEHGLDRPEPDAPKDVKDEYVRAAQEIIAREGYEQPAFVSHVDVRTRARPGKTATGGELPSVPGGVKTRTGALQRMGAVEEGLGALVRGSIRNPVGRRKVFGMWRQFLKERSVQLNGRREFTSDEIGRMYDDRVINPKDTVAVPRQLYKRTFDEAQVLKSTAEETSFAFDDFLTEMEQSLRHNALELGAPKKDRLYMLVPREALEELVSQSRSQTGIGAGLTRAQRITSRLILGTSPAWLSMQFIAEGAQALAAVNPVDFVRGLRAFRKLTPEEQWGFQAMAGESPGAGQLGLMRTTLDPGDYRNAANALSVMNRTPLGRAVKSTAKLEALGHVDRWKSSVIRRGVAGAHVLRLNREVNGFLGGVRNLWKAEDKLFRQLKGKTPEQQMAWVQKNPKAATEIAQYVDDVMGNWTALTRYEQNVAPLVIFYPFLRMSLRWVLRSYPKRHPVKSGILQYLGAANAVQLEQLLQGEPSFFSQWAQVPIYTDEDNVKLVDLSRAAPGGNAIFEAIGGNTDPATALTRTLNPVVGAVATGLYGKDSFGEEVDNKGLAAVEALLSLPTALRLMDQATTLPGAAEGRFDPGQETGSSASKAFEKLSPDKVLRSGLLPVLPLSVENERGKVKLGKLLDERYDEDALVNQVSAEALPRAIEQLDDPKKVRRAIRETRQVESAKDKLAAFYRGLGISYDEDELKDSDWDRIAAMLGGRFIPYDYKANRKVRRSGGGTSTASTGGDFNAVFGGGTTPSGGGGDFARVFGG